MKVMMNKNKPKKELLQKLRWNLAVDITDLPRNKKQFLIIIDDEITLAQHILGDRDEYHILIQGNGAFGNTYFTEFQESHLENVYWMHIPDKPKIKK
jgi:hypothetical protein